MKTLPVFAVSPLMFFGGFALLCNLSGNTTDCKSTSTAAPPSFSKDVAPIILKNCATCHHPGEVAPFSLLTYADVSKHAKQIAAVTSARTMPPWKAESHGEFNNERRLSDNEIALIGEWANSGTPMGDPKSLPETPKFNAGWKLGKPDRVLGLGEPFKVDPDGRDIYRCFVIPANVDAEQYIQAMEVHPGNKAIVHHVIAYVDTSGAARKLDEADAGPGYSTSGGGPGFVPAGFIGGWAPGNEPRFLPDGVGNLIPKGSDIVLEVHYHKNGKPESDQTQVGVYFNKTPVHKRIRSLMVINPFLRIPAGAENHPVTANAPIFKDITVLDCTPHMHLVGHDMRVDVTLPDNTKKQLVNVPNWDFNWQTSYQYKNPLKIPSGSKVSLLAHYNNSTSNPHNPNSVPKVITWGEQTTDEMCIAFIAYTVDEEDLIEGKSAGNARIPSSKR
ncbi:MAG: ascorbate-dependent monooxygenase [Chthonomonadales bacterium]